jgi:dihydrofolate reductase
MAAGWSLLDDTMGQIMAEWIRRAGGFVPRTLDRVTWHHSTLLRGDVAEAVGRLKDDPGGELQVHGSGELIQTLLRHHLIDEFQLRVFPVVLGTGKRLFGGGTVPAAFELVETRTSTTGALLKVYRAAGSLTYGSFMLEPPTAEEMARRARMSPAPR